MQTITETPPPRRIRDRTRESREIDRAVARAVKEERIRGWCGLIGEYRRVRAGALEDFERESGDVIARLVEVARAVERIGQKGNVSPEIEQLRQAARDAIELTEELWS